MQTEEYARLFEHEDHYWWYVARRNLATQLLTASISHFETSRQEYEVLDLGCGTGALIAEATDRGLVMTGLDSGDLALKFSKQRNIQRLVKGDASQLPFLTESFDAVIALDIFEHVEDDMAAFRESLRILRPGGILVLSVPAFQWLWGPHDEALMHFRRYQAKEVQGRLKSAGYLISRNTYSVFFLFPAVVLVRFLDRMRKGPAKVSLPRVPNWLNECLIKLQQIEAWCLTKLNLPWGSSVVAVAKKPTRDLL